MYELMAVVVSICALFLTFYQGYLQRKSYREQVFSEFVAMWLRADEIFIQKPHLRAYFYSGKPVSAADAYFDDVMAVAELFDDIFAYSYDQAKYIPDAFNASYKNYRARVMAMPAFQTYKQYNPWINNAEEPASKPM